MPALIKVPFASVMARKPYQALRLVVGVDSAWEQEKL
jgi:hypothetical protein